MRVRHEMAVVGAAVTCFAVAASAAGDAGKKDAADWKQARKQLLDTDPQLRHDPHSILVKFHDRVGEPAKAKARGRARGHKLRAFERAGGIEHLQVEDVDQALQALQNDPDVEFAEPDYVVYPSAMPNDGYFGSLWGLNNTGQTVSGDRGTAGFDINAPEAWDLFTGDAGFAIAIVDTGVQLNHPDLAGNIWTNPGEVAANGIDDDANGYVDDVWGWDFYQNDNDPSDPVGHGTHTAGTVGAAGNNALGVAGVNWTCKLVALRFLGSNGGYTSDAIEAIQYCVKENIRVSNNSWGGGGYSSSLYNAISAARSVGHVFVAAAGNGGYDGVGDNNDSAPEYPASYNLDNIISVAAVDNDGNRAGFSNYGATSVDIGAPGVRILSTYPSSGYAYLNGTSMATPHVAGVVGLVYAQHPDWTYQQVREQVLSTARPLAALSGITATGGMVDAAAAVTSGSSGGDADITPPTLVSAVSRKTHGTAGTFDISLPLSRSVPAGVECRSGGPSYLVLTFSEDVKPLAGTIGASQIKLSAGTLVSALLSGPVLTIQVNGVAGGGCLRVTLSGIGDLAGNPLAGENMVRAASLPGDANGDGTTNSSDVALVQGSQGRRADASNFRLDLYVDGTINSTDLNLATTRQGRSVTCQ